MMAIGVLLSAYAAARVFLSGCSSPFADRSADFASGCLTAGSLVVGPCRKKMRRVISPWPGKRFAPGHTPALL